MAETGKGHNPDTSLDGRHGRSGDHRFLASIVALCVFVFIPCAWAVNVDVGDDIYKMLLRLEAEGVIQSGLLTTKPLSHAEAARLVAEAERNVKDKSSFLKQLVGTLKRRLDAERGEIKNIKLVDNAYIGYIYSDQVGQELNYNNDGDTYDRGSSLRLGLTTKGEFGSFSFSLNPEYRLSEDSADVLMKKAYVALNFRGLELELGKDSQWWGPGRHGSILLSNNAEPLTSLKLTNPHPTLLPWVLRYLGPFRFVFFTSRLEEERVVPEPYLWGLRLNFKPTPYIEIGLQRTTLLGGAGRPNSFDTWWKSFTGMGGNEISVEGDQRAGGDIKITLPFKTQPFQLYIEAAGEDEAGNLPSKWAHLAGIYLPRIFFFERLGFRAEYANTSVDRANANVWYNHSIYRSGYTYKGRIMGHHMGTNSDDLFFELSYLLPEWGGGVEVSYDRERHNLLRGQKFVKDEVSITFRFDLMEDLRVGGGYSFGKLKGSANENISLFVLNVTYRF